MNDSKGLLFYAFIISYYEIYYLFKMSTVCEHGLLIERQGRYFCANCMYDYTQLNDDRGKLDEILLENIKEGGFGFPFSTALYERVTLVSPQEATEYFKRLAEDNNIELLPNKRSGLKRFWPF